MSSMNNTSSADSQGPEPKKPILPEDPAEFDPESVGVKEKSEDFPDPSKPAHGDFDREEPKAPAGGPSRDDADDEPGEGL